MNDKATNEIRKELIWVILLRAFFEATTIFCVYLLFIATNYFVAIMGDVFKSSQNLGQLWLFISITIAIIWIGLDSARYIQQKPLIFPLLPLMPLLVQTVEALLIELLISVIVILPLLNFNVLSANQISFLVAIIIVFFESARRTSKISTLLHRITFRIITSTKKAAGEIKKSWLSIVYWLLTVAFLVIASKLLIQGLAVPFDNEPDTAQELFSNVLTLVTAILAIFFTGATLIIQLIVGVYSFRFTTVISRNPIVIGSFAIIILIGLGHLAVLRVGWNSYLASLSLYSSIYTILVLAVLVILFIEYIQVPNVVKIVSREIQRYIKSSPKPKSLLKSTLLKTGKVSLFFQIKSFLLGYLLGDLQSPYLVELSSYNLPKEIHKEITEKVRPLFSACLKAINDDRREISLVCLSEINEIHKSYIIKFKDTLYGGDEFLMFLFSQFEIVFDVSVKVTNQQFTSDIVDTLILIGKNSLVLTNREQRENQFVGIWVGLLGDSVVKSLHLQHTSAQMAACSGMFEIGEELIKQHTYNTALYVVADKLQRVGKTVANVKHTWLAAITQRICTNLLNLLIGFLVEARRSNTYHQHYIRVICKHLRDVLEVAYKEQNNDVLTLNSIINSIVGHHMGGNLTSAVSIVLTNWPEKTSRTEYILLEGVREILFLIKQSIQSILARRNASVEDYCNTLAEIAWMLINFIMFIREDHARKTAQSDLKLVIRMTEGLFDEISKKHPNNTYYSFRELSPIYAFLIYYYREQNNEEFLELYKQSVENIISIIDNRPEDDEKSQDFQPLFSYLKLFGAWFYQTLPSDPFVKSLVQSLRRNGSLAIHFRGLGYPRDSLSDDWRISWSNTWASTGEEITNSLNNSENYFEFDNLINIRKKKKP